MDQTFIDRIDRDGRALPASDHALHQGEALHRAFRSNMPADYAAHVRRMAAEGAGLIQLIDNGEVRAIAVWRAYLTTYVGRRFEIDDLVTADGQRSKGYGATMIRTLEAKARSLSCDAVMLTSATWRTDAHRFYLRERYVNEALLFAKALTP